MSHGWRTTGALGSAGAGVGAATVAAAASACCVGPVAAPLIVGLLGAGGAAWAAGLKPYSPYLLAGSAALLAYAFWGLYGWRDECSVDDAASSDRSRVGHTAARVIAWLAAVLWVGAVAVNVVFG